ncbi:hsp90 co-chaperone Cdc37 [Neocucurbitaria cava]|uniref:Hsp90 chaperone protein kinase-targeting subunit n=1 Tax=Neocucurbitaria cava TaxID=798079 RepID=A0A9W8YDI4_9PLEO|nr:hsp90 co-chaperone Cdc37 [Neocucurbitaria cava]
MVINYSKWDALELSDDSDIEVHPNVDKKSFIRAKQAQIHQERDHRRHQIKTLKYERIINDGLTERVDRLLTALKSHRAKQAEGNGANDDQLVFQAMMESMMDMKIDKDGGSDRPPPPPEGVHEHIKDKPTYPQMMASLVDAVKKDIDASKSDEPRYDQFIKGLEKEKARIEDLQQQLYAKLAEVEKEEKKHITSEDIHEGFSYSNVRKGEEPKPVASSSSSSAPKQSAPSSTVELLNAPKRPEASRTDTGDSGAEADVERGTAIHDEDEDNEDDITASPLAQSFAKIRTGDWYACLQFLMQHPEIMAEKETDGLLVEAFNSELDGKPKHARQCVHQGLLLQYCRQLGGRQGVELFFKRIQMKDHQAGKMFNDDVDSTYGRIKTRAAEILKERAENPQSAEGVEQIQLHAVDPGTQINISVPPAQSTSSDPEERQAEEQARQIFDSFPPGLQRALESGKLDEVNKVLAKMSVEEAEEIVEKLGAGGMLSLEQGVIDATTEEGQRAMEEIEKTRKFPGGGGGQTQV